MEQKASISYFLSHPIQYISPLLVEMSKEFNLHVYYFSDASLKGEKDKEFGQVVKWDIPLLEGYRSTFIPNNSPWPGVTNGFFNLINLGLFKYLRNDTSEIVIVNGWRYFSTILTIIYARILGKKVWVRGENPWSQELNKSKKLLFVKKLVLTKFLFRFINNFLYIGKESKLFFENYGVKPDALVYTPYCVDNKFFASRYNALKNEIYSIKLQLGLPVDKKIILVSGKYIQKKRPIDILKAFKQLNDPATALVMVGEGELREEMEAFIAENNLKNVFLTGFINQTKIPEYYTIADVFVMCSGAGETWGLSVNEAMNFEKAVIVTSTCGCSADLVKNGKNGFIIEEGNIEQLTSALDKLLNDEQLRRTAGKLSGQMIKNYSIDEIILHLKAAS